MILTVLILLPLVGALVTAFVPTAVARLVGLGFAAATLVVGIVVDRPPTAEEPPSTTPSTPTRSKVVRPPTSDPPGRTTTASLIASP